jgi:hypothetical protein
VVDAAELEPGDSFPVAWDSEDRSGSGNRRADSSRGRDGALGNDLHAHHFTGQP